MKKISIFICLALLMAIGFIECATHKTSAYSNYETLIIGTELDGSYTLRTYGKARNSADAYIQAGKQAVRDMLFETLYFKDPNQMPLKPILLEPNAKQKYEDYFNAFFRDGGDYKKYISMDDKRIGSSKFTKTESTVSCVTTVRVKRAELKQKLIEDGIIK